MKIEPEGSVNLKRMGKRGLASPLLIATVVLAAVSATFGGLYVMMRGDLQNTKSELSSLKDNHKELLKAKNRVENELNATENKLMEVRGNRRRIEENYRKLKSVRQEMENDLKGLRNKFSALNDNYDVLKEKYSLLKENHRSYVEEIKKTRPRLHELVEIISNPRLFLTLPTKAELIPSKYRDNWGSRSWPSFNSNPERSARRLKEEFQSSRLFSHVLKKNGFKMVASIDFWKKGEPLNFLKVYVASFKSKKGAKGTLSRWKKSIKFGTMCEIYSVNVGENGFGFYRKEEKEYQERPFTYDRVIFQVSNLVCWVKMGNEKIEKQQALPYARSLVKEIRTLELPL